MKTFMRVTALITVAGIIALTIAKRYPVPHDLSLFMIIVVVTVLYIAVFYVFWFLLFRHWSKARFSSRVVKWIWFWDDSGRGICDVRWAYSLLRIGS